MLAGDASACSCVRVDPEADLAQADGAFVGRLVSRSVRGPKATLVFEVETPLKGGLGRRVEVESATQSATCGLGDVERGTRMGLLLTRRGDRWESGLCQQVAPAALLAAVPSLDERPPIPTLVGGAVAGLLLLGAGLLVARRRRRSDSLGR